MRNESRIATELGKRLHDALEQGPSQARRAAQRKEVESMASLPARRSPLVWIGAAAAVTAACLVAVFLYTQLHTSSDPFEHLVGSETNPTTTDNTRLVQFRDGSQIMLSPDTRLHVSRATRDNVSLTLDAGTVDVDIRQKGTTTWKLHAGPYTVTVHGTVFSVSWKPALQALDVEVDRGLVGVKGPELTPAGKMLSASESLHVGEPDTRLALEDEPPATGEPVVDPQIEEEIDQDAGAIGESEPKHSMPAWKKLSRQGKHKEAIGLVEADFDKLVKTLSQPDLWDLATSARLARKGSLALTALQSFRSRFPGSANAATALFLLGRVEMDLEKKPAKAAQWFQKYLKDHPDGSLAEDALGRLVTAHRKAGNDAAARKAASAYLQKYPAGTYRDLALAVLSNS
jgi:TolA-binding protein